jgi:hypothetical protein
MLDLSLIILSLTGNRGLKQIVSCEKPSLPWPDALNLAVVSSRRAMIALPLSGFPRCQIDVASE